MKRFDKYVDINEKITELKLAMKNINNIRFIKDIMLYLNIYKD